METKVKESLITRDNKDTIASLFNNNGKVFNVGDDGDEFHGEGITILFQNDKMIIEAEGIELHNDKPKHQFWFRLHQLLDLK